MRSCHYLMVEIHLFPDFSKASDTAKKALVDLVGGIDELSGKMSSYYENFYSEAEKLP